MNGRWTNTLIADEQGLYDPSSTNDRMVLGIRGQVSELERDSLVRRMVEARWNKARCGEAFTIPPAGYELDEEGQLQFSSDEAVQAAVRRVFEKFDQLGAARQVFLWWRSEGLNFPVRKMASRTHPIVWRPICYRLIYQMLRHPIYAGAFVFGRSESRRELDPETHKIVLRRGLCRVCEGWPVLIQDHHPGYISFEKYLDNQEQSHRNALMTSQPTDESHQGAPRRGRALLQGLMRRGHCGRRTLQYRCARYRLLEPECQLVGGKRIEAAGVEAFLLVAQAAGPEAVALAGERLRAEIETAERQWKLRIEKAEYEAQRAERQYMAVEPENRTVARELERRWNERLLELETLHDQAAKVNQGRRPLTEMGLARAQDLGMNLQAVWHDDPAAGECARFSLVAHWVKQGKLKAARTTVGNRQCWRIEVPSTDCGNQPGLFDQMGNAITEEP